MQNLNLLDISNLKLKHENELKLKDKDIELIKEKYENELLKKNRINEMFFTTIIYILIIFKQLIIY